MTRLLARRALPVLSIVFLGGTLLQVFLAGLGVFDDPRSFLTHRDVGYGLGLLTPVLLVLAIVGRAQRRLTGLAALLLGQFALQSILVLQRDTSPAVAALHPVNGVLIVLVGAMVARLAWLGARVPDPDPTTRPAAATRGVAAGTH